MNLPLKAHEVIRIGDVALIYSRDDQGERLSIGNFEDNGVVKVIAVLATSRLEARIMASNIKDLGDQFGAK